VEFPASWDLSFVIGVFLGDGSFVEDRDYHHHVKIIVRDRDLAEAFTRSLSRVLSRRLNRIVFVKNQGKTYYESKYSCRALGLLLKQPFDYLRPLIDANPEAFIRGLFSADGCASASLLGGRLRVQIVLANSDVSLLRTVEDVLLTGLNIHSKTYLARRKGASWKNGKKTVILREDAYQLHITRMNDVRVFADKIGFAIHRKQAVLKTAIRLIESVGGTKAAKEWCTLYSKIGPRWQPRSETIIN
jgi:intein-encoded DNA endonuclease-like protein